jgi:integrase
VDEVAHYLNDPYRAAVILMAYTGLRFGEMAGLHWHRVDLVGGSIDVVETWDDAAGRIKGYPKSGRTRRVPLPTKALEAIGMPTTAKTCGLDHVGGSRCRSGLVIPAKHGGALDARNMRNRHWTHALARAGLEHARLHDLRHTYASWLLQGGASLSEVAEVMGHSSITVTSRYAHLAPSHADKVRSLLEV